MAEEDPEELPIAAGLQLYWYEIGADEAPHQSWGQLAGGMHRLLDLREDLESATRIRDIEQSLRRLVIYVEAFFARVYELRERAVMLLGQKTAMPEDAKALKKATKRSAAGARLAAVAPRLTAAVVALLGAMDEDTALRNIHTHEQYLGLGLFTTTGPFDPGDALLDLERTPKARVRLVTRLQSEARALARQYDAKITELARLTKAVLGAGDIR